MDLQGLIAAAELAADGSGRAGGPVFQQQFHGAPQLPMAISGAGVVEGHHKIPLGRRFEPLFD